jgi:tetratricopeptide (TPR) repeat protein
MLAADSHIVQGFQYLAAGNATAASRIAVIALKRDSYNASAHHLAGLAANQAGDATSAIAHLECAARLRPTDAELVAHLGSVLGLAGRLSEAQEYFRKAIELDPKAADPHYNLAKLLREEGRLAGAIEEYREALRIRPTFVEAVFNLANTLREVEQLEEAVATYEHAISLRPNYLKALNNLGNLLVRLGRPEKSFAVFEKALALKPDYAEGHYNLGCALRALCRPSEAAESFRRAIEIHPALIKAHVAIADLRKDEGRFEEALAHYRPALQPIGRCAAEGADLAPRATPNGGDSFDIIRAWNNMGSCFVMLRQWTDAEPCFQYVLSRDERNPVALNNLGVIRMADCKLAEAQTLFERALEVKDDYAEAHSNLAAALQDQGRFNEAEKHYARTFALEPGAADPHWNRSLLRLARGQWSDGWEEYEWRWQRPEFCRSQFRCPPSNRIPAYIPSGERIPQVAPAPLWDGTPLDGRSILLFTEQGLGDVIQFARFAALLQARGGRVVLECPTKLRPLLERCEGVERVIPQGEAIPPIDFQAPLLSLPRILRIDEGNLPRKVPYLRTRPERAEQWRPVISGLPGFKVGINWQGNPGYHLDRLRSMPLAEFAPLAAIPDVTLLSLQQGFGSQQAIDVQRLFRVATLGADVDQDGSFVDTAAILGQLDLVVTSDTALAHLAGALGISTWVVLPYVADWRWGLAGDECPWYPTIRLFRQPRPGDWKPVFACVADKLRELIQATSRAAS